MKKLRIATIGIGRFGIYHLHAFKQLEKTCNVELVAASDSDHSKRILVNNTFDIPIYEDYTEMIAKEELDAVSVATQDHLHKDIVINALDNNLHVLVEKPLDTSSEGSLEMVKLADEKKLLLQVDLHKRYDPFHIEIKQLIDRQKIGKILYGYCHMEDQIVVPKDWFNTWVHNTSPAWFLGSNFIDLICWLMDSKVKKVYANGHKEKLVELGLDTYDSLHYMLTFENDAVITFDNSWILPENFSAIVNQGFRLIGTEGIVEADSHNRGTTSCISSEQGIRNHNSAFMHSGSTVNGSNIYEGYGIKSIQHFVENVLHLSSGVELEELTGLYPSGEEAHEVTKVIELIHQSAETGELINVETEKDYVQ